MTDPGIATYPATYTLDAPEKVANWRPLVQWLLAIPHFIVLYVIQIVGSFVIFASWVMIVITGKLPSGLADFSMMMIRYQTRVQAYAGWLHGEYPPFDFTMSAADPGGTPVRVDFVPALENRNRLTVFFRLFVAIPAFFFAMIIGIVGYFVWIAAFFAVLFTGKWPQGLLGFANGVMRVGTRLNAYFALLTDEYPPFSTD